MSWFAVEVVLVEGGGQRLEPPPGRVLLVAPGHTFAQLAAAIDVAFGRWDRGPAHHFELPGERRIGPADAAGDVADETLLPVGGEVDVGERFTYLFDPEQRWVHRCRVEETVPEPAAGGVRGGGPLPVDGWGAVPDQHGRRARETVAAAGVVDLVGAWDADDRRDLRAAAARGDGVALVALLRDRPHLHDVLQLTGDALAAAVTGGVRGAPQVAARCVASLRERDWPGDATLAAQLEAALGAPVPALQPIPVDLDELSTAIDDSGPEGTDHRLHVDSGELLPAVDVEAYFGIPEPDDWEDPDAWIHVAPTGSRPAYRDMVAFADQVTDPDLAERLYDALDGRGAFARFRRIVFDQAPIGEAWRAFSQERELGRARAWLADEGYRPAPS